jgi:hypothetical protein
MLPSAAIVAAMTCGCGLFPPTTCTLEAVFGINISLVDAAGEPVTGATITSRDGEFEETLTELTPGNYAGAVERAGSYDLTIEAEGFATVELQNLDVIAGDCHVEPITRNVVMPPSGTGISGRMLAGPQCPVVTPDSGAECDDQPYQGTVVVHDEAGGNEVTRFTAAADGTFDVPLPAGSYLLMPLPGPNGFPFADEQVIDVVTGAFTQIQILYDTGIR